jgi:2-oxoglutarate ferredoxin oxidoreductase subunit alpha
VLSASTSGECFDMAIEAVRIALRHMTPVILLADGYLSNAAEPWQIPDIDAYEPISCNTPQGGEGSAQRQAFTRHPETLGRTWITPGMPGLMHRIGGLEKDITTGHISYDPANHQQMTDMRAAKLDAVSHFIPDQGIELGDDTGDLVVVGWGSTYGPIYQAARATGVSFVHLRYLNPLPSNLGALLGRFDRILVPEMNNGQLATLLRDKLCVDPLSYCKVSGQPFLIRELIAKIEAVRGDAS